MLDTNTRKYVQPIIEKTAKIFIKIGFNANGMTIMGCIVGLLSALFVFIDKPIIAVIVLWISGLMDALDGTIARIKNEKSSSGMMMDIVFDRLVEQAIIIMIALQASSSMLILIILNTSIILCMTVFLTVGTFANIKSEKSFYYQAGIMERTETFIFLTLMILFRKYLNIITVIFIILILFTTVQRFVEGLIIAKRRD